MWRGWGLECPMKGRGGGGGATLPIVFDVGRKAWTAT